MNKGYSIGLVPFFPCGDRFVPGGYRKDNLSLAAKLKAAAAIHGVEAVELSYPADFDDPALMKKLLDDAGLVASNVEIELFGAPKWKYGALCAMDKKTRREAIELSKKGMDATAAMGCGQISLWPGQDGFDYPMQLDYKAAWDNIVASVTEIASHNGDINIAIEYKIKEARTHLQLATVGKCLALCQEVDRENTGVMIDVGHAMMAYENPAESAVILARHNKLFHLHFNDNFRMWDDDLMVGTVHLWETIELLYWLKQIGYRGWYSLDIFPYREESSDAIAVSLENLEKLRKTAEGLDSKKVAAMQLQNDAASMARYLRDTVLK